MNFKRVLFIQLKMLGDILMLTPAIRAFKQKYPNTILDVAVERPGDDLLRYNPYVDNLIVLGSKRWYDIGEQAKFIRNIRRNKYDMVIDFLGNPRSSHYSFASGAPLRVGYSDARYRYAYTEKHERIFSYSAHSKLEFLKFLDISSEDMRPEFILPENIKLPDSISHLHQMKAIAISPVSLRQFNVWPISNYAKVVDFLYNKFGFQPAVIVGPGERAYLDDFKKLATIPYLPLYIDNLYVLGATFKKCRMLIGNDNGPKHIAVALGLPTYAVFSHKRDPINWSYPDERYHRFSGGKNRPDCAPITEIAVDNVIERISDMIIELGINKLEEISCDDAHDNYRQRINWQNENYI